MSNTPKPVYKTVEELYDFMEARGACQDGLDFISSCKTLEQVYKCNNKSFRHFAISEDLNLFYVMPQEVKDKCNTVEWRWLVEHQPALIHRVPRSIQDKWGTTEWRWLVQEHLCLFHYVPADVKARWTYIEWSYIIQHQPSLEKYAPTGFHLPVH